MPYDQDEAENRHSRRRRELQNIRDELTGIVNDYYSDVPQSERGESDLEARIEDRLGRVQRQINDFIREFRNLSND